MLQLVRTPVTLIWLLLMAATGLSMWVAVDHGIVGYRVATTVVMSVALVKAYLVGIANLVQVETAFYAANPPSDSQNFVPRLARGLKGHTLDSVRQGLDRWYAANPGKLQRPVLETIWFEMAVPGLKK